MRSVNISLDLYSCLLCLILMCYLLFSHTRRTASSRCFILMCTLNIIISLGDITNWACEGYAKPWFPAVLNAGSMLFYFCIGPLLLTFTAYICACLGPQVTVHRGFWYVESALCGAQMLFSLLSLWNGMYFTILPGNVYSRGSALWLALLVPFLMFAGDSVLLAVYRKYLRRKHIFFLVCYIVLPMALNSFQVFHYGIALLNTGISISLLLIFINIQSERELQLQKQEKQLAEMRIDMMLSQIQPHFLYNTLTAIRRLCAVDPQLAQRAISDFSLFLRGNTEALTNRTPIPFSQELKHVQHYLSLEQLRFGTRLHVVYEISATDFLLPPLTLQPIVENAVRHGIAPQPEGGTITIHTWETPDSFHISVADDGVGFSPHSPDDRTHIGLENVRERLAAVCGGALQISIPEKGHGTVVLFTIPKEETA